MEQNIWNHLRQAGLTPAGTAAVMGNLWAESGLESNNLQNTANVALGMTDDEFVHRVDTGVITRDDLIQMGKNSYGFGLAQWTYYTRLGKLWDATIGKGVSIANEDAQLDFMLTELRDGYLTLLNALKTSSDLYAMTSRFCTDFERPAVNNIQTRYTQAHYYLRKYGDTPVEQGVSEEKAKFEGTCKADMPILKKGDKGLPVGWVQMALIRKGYDLGNYGPNKDGVDCDFGSTLEKRVCEFKVAEGLPNGGSTYGKITGEVWNALWK